MDYYFPLVLKSRTQKRKTTGIRITRRITRSKENILQVLRTKTLFCVFDVFLLKLLCDLILVCSKIWIKDQNATCLTFLCLEMERINHQAETEKHVPVFCFVLFFPSTLQFYPFNKWGEKRLLKKKNKKKNHSNSLIGKIMFFSCVNFKFFFKSP